MKRLSLSILFVSLLAPSVSAAVEVDREDLIRITGNIVCTCGSSGCPPTHLVRHCSCANAQKMSQEVASLLAEGKNDEEIYGYYIERFGATVMASPNAEGFNLLGWSLPFVALVLGGGVVVGVYRRLRTTQAASPPAARSDLDPKYREMLDRELAE